MRKIFVAGIGTDVGKTVVAAIITEALRADYWKPVQTGNLFGTDTDKVKSLISNSITVCHPEVYNLKPFMSPHAASEIENVPIELKKINVPVSDNKTLVIEGAGGVMVPLNKDELIIDIIKKTDAEVVLVADNYLGCINHTLLSVEVLLGRGCKITGIVFNGSPNEATRNIILHYTACRELLYIQKENEINKELVLKYAAKISPMLLA